MGAHENKLSTDIIYFDLSKAFDSVPHKRLIEKLSQFGIRGALLDLIKHYLSNRTYTVRVGERYSAKKEAISGVPQGSVGGPILFVIYIADIIDFCRTDNVIIKLFADDLKAYHMSKIVNEFNIPLQNFIKKLSNYCELNGLFISPKKCNVLHVGNKNPKISYYLSNSPIHTIENNHSVRDLGLYFNADLNWTSHIDITIKKARRTSFALVKSIKLNDCQLLVNLFKTYVRPTLEFATNVYNPYLLKDINAIEKVQKDFLKITFKKSNRKLFNENPSAPIPSYSELLAINSLESLELRRLKSDLYLFHKYLHGWVKISCRNPYEIRETKTRGEKYKIFPVTCKTIIRHNSFFLRTSRIYVSLPNYVRQTNPIEFKNKLNKCCLSKYLKCKL